MLFFRNYNIKLLVKFIKKKSPLNISFKLLNDIFLKGIK